MKKAFTLVELAIVLVIIGLLTAGVVGGQSLIESSKRSSLISQFNGYNTAIKAFQLEYDAMPGDFKDGFLYWGSASCTNQTISVSNQLGCNGNGDKVFQIDFEGLLHWKHLSLSGILPGNYSGTYTGTWAAGDCCLAINTNSPKTPYDNHTFWLRMSTDDTHFNSTALGLLINRTGYRFAGIVQTGTHRWARDSLLKAKDVVQIDSKLDDGKAISGNVIIGADSGSCYSSSSANGYLLTSNSCSLYFLWN